MATPLLPSALEFQRVLKRLASSAERDVAAMWDATDGYQEVEDAFPQIVDRYAGAAGTLAAQFYQELSDKPFEVRVAALPPQERSRGNVGYAFSRGETIVDYLKASASRHTFTSARETIVTNATRERVTFVRVASPDACPWCQVLATNEPRYLTEESAIAGHDNCSCVAAPVRSGTRYTPPAYVQEWTDKYVAARNEVGGNLDDIVNYLRRAEKQTV